MSRTRSQSQCAREPSQAAKSGLSWEVGPLTSRPAITPKEDPCGNGNLVPQPWPSSLISRLQLHLPAALRPSFNKTSPTPRSHLRLSFLPLILLLSFLPLASCILHPASCILFPSVVHSLLKQHTTVSWLVPSTRFSFSSCLLSRISLFLHCDSHFCRHNNASTLHDLYNIRP
ncbi:hypothetical protein GE09DRAFT_290544 [Coniochaeta sp. 2T2.1]|nr:hypothetical protein GE09DRAFT_290544 [Coniochaeta sp. 2T2.1]